MNRIQKEFNCGKLYVPISANRGKNPIVSFSVTRLSDFNEKILPLFDQCPLQGLKFLNYMDFCKVVLLMNDKAHLTVSGLEQISSIKTGMNYGRT